MPFSSLNDPVDVARAQAALDRAWQQLKPGVSSDRWEREHSRLAHIVAAFAMVAIDEDDLVDRAIERFKRPSP